VKRIIDAAHSAGIPVGMCGEAAADKKMIPLLISFGLDEFSVNPASVLEVRKCISQWNKKDADELTEKVMSLPTQAEVLAALEEI
jgi:phosphotransferase system enzyme I (PtsI)